jgi:hypothetical protein
VRAQQDREEQAVVIATALGIFTGILLAVGLLAWWVQSLTHGLDGHDDVIGWTAVLVAAVAAGSYVARSSRR